MKVSETGEFGLIGLIKNLIEQNSTKTSDSFRNIITGIGDDAAVWNCDFPTHVATTDCLVQDVHFDLDIITWEELGHKALAVNLSDIAAMGGIPRYALVSLSLPGNLETADIEQMYKGMIALANQFGTSIVGGNISIAPILIINITVFGSLKGKNALTRAEAKTGDQIAVTGHLGLSAAGLKMMSHSLKFSSDTTRLFREAHNKPIPRVNEGQTILLYDVKAAIDISDGLLADLQHLCEASKVAAVIKQDKLPVHSLMKRNFSREYTEMALTGGEDYELIFTASLQIIERLKTTLTCPVTIIGEIVGGKAGDITILDNKGIAVPFENKGWDHFKNR